MAVPYTQVSDPFNFSAGDNIVEVPSSWSRHPPLTTSGPDRHQRLSMTTVRRLNRPNAVSSVDVLLHLTTDTADKIIISNEAGFSENATVVKA